MNDFVATWNGTPMLTLTNYGSVGFNEFQFTVQADAASANLQLSAGSLTEGDGLNIYEADWKLDSVSVMPLTGSPSATLTSLGDITQPGTFHSTFTAASASDLQSVLTTLGAGAINFALPGSSVQAWDLSYSGEFFGGATVTLHFDPTLIGSTPLSDLYVEHFMNGAWVIPTNQVIDPLNDTITFVTDSFSPFMLAQVPEPNTLVLAASGFAGLIAFGWRRRLQRIEGRSRIFPGNSRNPGGLAAACVVVVVACFAMLNAAAAGDIVFWDDPSDNAIYNTTQSPPVVLSSGQMTFSDAGLAVDRFGAVYVGYTPTSGPTGVLKISPDGQSQSMLAAVADPVFLAADLAGDVYAGGYDGGIERISPDGSVSPFYASAAGPLAVDEQGNVYATTPDGATLLEISPAGVASTLASAPNPGGWNLDALAVDPSGNVWFNYANPGFGAQTEIFKMAPGGASSLVYSYDGPQHLFGLAAGTAGDIYTEGLKIDPSGVATTFPAGAHYALAVQPVPEPSTLLLAGLGLVALFLSAGWRRRRST